LIAVSSFRFQVSSLEIYRRYVCNEERGKRKEERGKVTIANLKLET